MNKKRLRKLKSKFLLRLKKAGWKKKKGNKDYWSNIYFNIQ